ncbi:MAG TPA: 7-cyano-7-deazaguanine synthase QueC [Phycisphaerales bacterium]|nr:7-cyano-7-deazaguanine synthase QueC [Phycisphaerales bacterium]
MNASSFTPPPAVVLLSGGLDSATTLAVASRPRSGEPAFACHTLAFDYGQRHRHELVAAAHVASALHAASHTVVNLDLRSFGGSALTADIAVPKDRTDHDIAHGGGGVPITYVPARNLVFLSLATAYAETLGARDIFIGVNAVDYSGYPDCRPEFIRAFEHAANLGTALGNPTLRGGSASVIRIHAPLIDLSKADIIRLGVSLGVDYALTHSCYDPISRSGETLACGHCDSCHLRREGFKTAGIPDPTPYA